MPLHIFEPRYRLMIEYCSESDDELAIAPFLPDLNKKHQTIHDIYPRFGWGRIIQKDYLPDGRSNIILEGIGVAELIEYKSIHPFRIAYVKEMERFHANHEQENFKELMDEIVQLTKRLIIYENAPQVFMEMIQDIHRFQYPIDFICSLLQYDTSTRQVLLEEPDEIRRGEILRDLLHKINLRE